MNEATKYNRAKTWQIALFALNMMSTNMYLFSNLFPLSPFIRPQRTLLMNKKRALSERFFFQKVPSTIHIVGVVLLTTNHHSS